MSHLRPVTNREEMPAPNGWPDAYIETMENVWQHLTNPDGYDPTSVATMTAYAAEVRHGLAAGLLGVQDGTVRVPLVNVPMRHDEPRDVTACPRCGSYPCAAGCQPTDRDCPDCEHPYRAHHDLVGCAVAGCPCSRGRAILPTPDDGQL